MPLLPRDVYYAIIYNIEKLEVVYINDLQTFLSSVHSEKILGLHSEPINIHKH